MKFGERECWESVVGVWGQGYCRELGVYPSVRGLFGRSWVEVLQSWTNAGYYCSRLSHVNRVLEVK